MTLIEVLVGTLVALIALAGVLSSVVMATRMNHVNAQRFAAFGRCKEVLEDLRDRPFEEVLNGYPSNGESGQHELMEFDIPLLVQGREGGVNLTADRIVRITDYSHEEIPYYHVRVLIRWKAKTKAVESEIQQLLIESRLYNRG